ncbi:MarR family transcriptional regulator [Melghirimyces profundicolus]|uniref:MarR family transcriptional regulator n=1 Tax=Melghirimyces profundicolus TaxID=1242148 RepID=A0A2T6BU21_9BACL|nr:MarR family winged helix-turn-helix transcriptional regulator [Melghirimyces profundicolus]PTX59588.1 MarR family transcriptional regulator [Melghirimyces profundicolus]
MNSQHLSQIFTSIYYHCHPKFTIPLSHSSVRALQYIAMNKGGTVREVAEHLGCAHNTASEILRRLADKKLLSRKRRRDDERVVELKVTTLGWEILKEQTGLDIEKLDNVLRNMPIKDKKQIFEGFSLLLKYVKEGS